MATLLTPANSDYVNAGESAVVEATLYDASGVTLEKSSVKTLTITLKDSGGTVINSRSASNVLDNDIGTLATDGTVTLKLAPLDNAFQGDTDIVEESHWMLLEWTWDDSDSDEQTGSELFEIPIRKMPG